MSGRYDDEDDYQAPPESFWQRLNRLLWVLLILTVVVIVIGAFLPELQKQRTEREQRERLHRLIDEQKALHSRYTREISWLQNDPEYLADKYARDILNLMKPGEAILLAQPPKAPVIEPEIPAAPRPKPDVAPKKPETNARKLRG